MTYGQCNSWRYLDSQKLDSQNWAVRIGLGLLLGLGLMLLLGLGLVFGLGLGLVMTIQIMTVQILTVQISTGNWTRRNDTKLLI